MEGKDSDMTPFKEEYEMDKVKIKKSEGDRGGNETNLLTNRARNSKLFYFALTLFNHRQGEYFEHDLK